MHIFQVGIGSGGMVVLDLLIREQAISRVTLIDPDVYLQHNVHRHLFPPASVGRPKVELAAEWIRERRPDLSVSVLQADITDPTLQREFSRIVTESDLGVCAVDNEQAKYAFDALMRANGKPWTLGEVLSGGIGGWIHRFIPGGPCYGCVASYLQRTVTDEPPAPPPDYANPGAAIVETTIPASKASIEAIASLHGIVTIDLLMGLRGISSKTPTDVPPANAGSEPFTSLLFTLRFVPDVFEDAFRTHRFRIPRAPECLICSTIPPTTQTSDSGVKLDVALDEALDRLAPQ